MTRRRGRHSVASNVEILEGLRRLGKPIGANDVWIAASAMQHGLRLVTTDEHFIAVAQIAKDVFRSIP